MTKHQSWVENSTFDEEDLTLYTNGSKMEHVGAGWAMCQGDYILAEESVYLGSYATVFQAEVIAITRGLTWASYNLDSRLKIKVISDSQASIGTIFHRQVTSKIVHECRVTIQEVRRNHDIFIEWIKDMQITPAMSWQTA